MHRALDASSRMPSELLQKPERRTDGSANCVPQQLSLTMTNHATNPAIIYMNLLRRQARVIAIESCDQKLCQLCDL